MKWREYHDKAERLDAQMRASPRATMARAIWYGLSGYFYAAVLIILFSVVVGALVALLIVMQAGLRERLDLIVPGIMLAVTVIFLCVFASKAWVRMTPPKGWALMQEDAPEIFRMIEKSRHTLRAPPVHAVLLQDIYNAGMASVPRFGLFGFPRNYMCLGVPFLMAHRPDELLATIAHEVGHTTGQQGRLHRWLYRLGQSWAQLRGMKTHANDVTGSVIEKMAKSYSTGLWMRANAIRRHYEFAADRASMEVAGRDAALNSLYRVEFYGEAMSRWFFRDIWRRAIAEELPPMGIWQRLQESMSQPLPPDKHALVSRVLAGRRTLTSEDHPCLRERLAALGGPAPEDVPPCEPIRPDESAIMLLTDAARARYIDLFANTWRASVIQNWRAVHERAKEDDKFLKELEAKPNLSERESLRQLQIQVMRARSSVDAEMLLRAFLVKHPGRPEAEYRLGSLLLEEERLADALPHLNTGIAGCSAIAGDALGELRQYYERYGMVAERAETEERIEAFNQRLEKARYETSQVFMEDKFVAHDLEPEFMESLAKALKSHELVARAWFVRKMVKQFADMKCYALMVEVKHKRFDTEAAQKEQRLVGMLASGTNLRMVVVVEKSTFETPRRNIQAVAGSMIFERDAES